MTRKEALSTRLDKLDGWMLCAWCPSCRLNKKLAIDDLAGRLGGATTIGSIVRRIRCSRCGVVAGQGTIENHAYGTGPDRIDVRLLG